VATCPKCGQRSAEGFRFCPYCGAPLSVQEPRTERKVVTILFCDLVGFTSRSDQADPEDVRAILQPFHTLAKAEIERYGGTLDKFIGDAAMGVFGSPIAHEDDPERAVRAGMRILDGVRKLHDRTPNEALSVRIGVNTGEAVVALAAGVQVGENVAGDVVNTASRLQGAAPAGCLIVGETTYRATCDAVEYQEQEPVIAKGKAKPLRVWSALSIRPLPTISDRPATAPFVGREVERGVLEQAFLRSVIRERVQTITVMGEPGAGKSRLVAELGVAIPGLAPGVDVQWRRGRCLPYGDGITFWALGEIVKDQAGILESDPGETRLRKLGALLAGLVADAAELAWLRARLGPLVGAEGGLPVEREESFTAWQRFLEAAAKARPLVAVFEDIHWADPSMLAFIEHVTEHVGAAPLLMIATARPELYDRYPSWGTGMRNATVISLPPLGAVETSALVSELLGAQSLPPETQSLLLERSGGNPLYAEEFARALRDRGLVDQAGRFIGDPAEMSFPDTVQALIAARLDTLVLERKGIVQDASVIGKVFWSGGVAFLSGAEEPQVREHLQALERKELVKPAGASTIGDQAEYTFWHALVRDVAYSQLPRAARASKHRKAAAWLESIAGERLGDLAEILAYHAISALEMARVSGETEGLPYLELTAARYLRLASGRAMALDVAQAEAQLLQALQLMPAADPDRPQVVASLAEAAFHAGRLDEADRRYEEAIASLRTQGYVREAAEAMTRRSVVLEYRGDSAAARALLSNAIDLLERIPPGTELALALATSAGSHLISGRYQEVIEEADRAIKLAERVGEAAEAGRAHGFRGYARAIQGDLGGIEEQWEALAGLRALGQGRATAIAYNNLASCLTHVEGSQAALDVFREAVAFAETRGLREAVMALQNSMLDPLFEVGEWDEVLRLGQEVAEEARREGSGYDEVFAEADRAAVLACRLGADARDFCESVLERSRPLEDAPLQMRAMIATATARLAAQDRPGTSALVREVLQITQGDAVTVRASELPHLVRLAVGAGDPALADSVLEGCEGLGLARYRLSRLAAEAVIEESGGRLARALERYQEAARQWAEHGHVFERAYALFGTARCLAGLGQVELARPSLEEARDAFARLGAQPALAEAQALLS
jgi:class 3 adenylate cyclase/tetratricopeptide (TPR) repeat protein